MTSVKIKLRDEQQGYRYEKVEWVAEQTVENDCLVLKVKRPGLYTNSETRHYPLVNVLMWSNEA